MIPVAKIQLIINTYENLEKELASAEINKNDFVKKSKEYSSIGEVINEARKYVDFEKEKKELEKIIEDKDGEMEIIKLASNELIELSKKK